MRFAAKLQGSFGIFETLENAKRIFEKTEKKRYYIDHGEQINLNCKIVVTSREWSSINILDFIKQANLLGLKIVRK